MSVLPSRKRIYRNRSKRSLCRGKKTKKCLRVKGCKFARGTKRRFCRKKHNIRS